LACKYLRTLSAIGRKAPASSKDFEAEPGLVLPLEPSLEAIQLIVSYFP
jgi:hypothetical protein